MNSKPVLTANLRIVDCEEIRGRIIFSQDKIAVLEAIASIVGEFSSSCKVPVSEVLNDISSVITEQQK